MTNMMTVARVERVELKRVGHIKKIKKGLHRLYVCNICDNGREYQNGGILIHFSRTHKKEYREIRTKTMEIA